MKAEGREHFAEFAARPSARPAAGAAGRHVARIAVSVVAILLVGMLARFALPAGVDGVLKTLPWLSPPTVTLYYPTADGDHLVPVTRVVDREAGVEDAITELLRGPLDRTWLTPAVEGDPPVVSREGATVVVTYGPASNPAAEELRAVELTLLALPTVSDVRFVGALTEDALAEPRAGPQLFYAAGPYVIPVPAPAGSTGLKEVLADYLRGEGHGVALMGLPGDVMLREIRLDAERNLLTVELSYTESLRELALNNEILTRRILEGLIATLTQFESVDAVLLNFDGRTRLGLGGCRDLLRAPQIAPTSLNDEEKTLSLAGIFARGSD